MDEPPQRNDPRFLLANERTLLAWIRTALALLAAGGGIYEFTDVSGRKALAIAVALVGIFSTAAGGLRYLATARAIRRGDQMTDDRSPVVLALAVCALGVGLVIALIVS